MNRHTLIPTMLLASLTLLPSGPAAADGSIGIHVGGAGFGFSFTAGDWAPYGTAWSDPGWRVDLDVALGSYGDWVWVDGLGRVWRPNVATAWRPYTNGRWVWTSYGWTWVAYEPWGYLPHHYGSWAFSSFGWVWTPGWQYSPANVVWVGHGDWIGWYPCAPTGWSHASRGFRHGFRDGYRRGYGDGYDDGWRDASHATWTRWRHLGDDNVAEWAGAPPDLGSAISRGRVRPLSGPPSLTSARAAGARIVETGLESRAVEVNGRRVQLVRPTGVAESIQRHGAETVRTAMPAITARKPAVSRDNAPAISDRRAAEQPRATQMPSTIDRRRATVADQPTKPGATLPVTPTRRITERPRVTEMPPMIDRRRAPVADQPAKPHVSTVPRTGRIEPSRPADSVAPRRERYSPAPRVAPRPVALLSTPSRIAPSRPPQPAIRPPARTADRPSPSATTRRDLPRAQPVPAPPSKSETTRGTATTARQQRPVQSNHARSGKNSPKKDRD